MTTDPQAPVEELSGRELDAAVAEEVFGLGVRWLEWHTFGEMPFSVDRPPHAPHHYERLDEGDPAHPGITVWFVENYSTDIADAWEVKASLESRGYGVTIVGPKGVFGGTFRRDSKTSVVVSKPKRGGGRSTIRTVRADTAPLAICRAALKAVRD